MLATPTGTITFRPGETSKTIKVGIIDDLDREPAETVGITLFKPMNATIGAAKSATVTIVDNDSYTASIVGRRRLAEDRIGEYKLQLSSPATKTETFYVNTEGGITTPGVDFRPLSQLPLIFSPGESVKRFRIQTLDDGIENKYDEFFFLRLTPMSAGFPKVDPFGITIPGIGPAPLPGVSVSDVTVTEGNADKTAASFTISLSARYGLPVTLNYATADGTATVADKDYESVTGSVTIAPGDTTAVVTVNVVGDTKFEPDETFSLVVSAPVNATLAKATGVATIRNDDSDPASGYQITLTYDNPRLPTAQKSVFEKAVQRLQAIVVGDIPDVPVGTRMIDDMEVTVYVEDMPAAYNGYAMATAFRPGSKGLPYQGEIHINQSRIGDPGIYHTIIHEMLHALGFSDTFFTATGTMSGLGTTSPLFTGANALRDYQAYFGLANSTGVPLYEDVAAEGSYASHWSRNVIGTEIMSVGWDTTSTALRPFSKITIGAMQDIGYTVNYAAADSYTRPSDSVSTTTAIADFAQRGWYGDTSHSWLSNVAAAIAGTFGEAGPGTGKQRAFARLAKG